MDAFSIPKHWPKHFNANTAPCDVINGPCACGSWHKLDEPWVAEMVNLYGLVLPKQREPDFSAENKARINYVPGSWVIL